MLLLTSLTQNFVLVWLVALYTDNLLIHYVTYIVFSTRYWSASTLCTLAMRHLRFSIFLILKTAHAIPEAWTEVIKSN